MTTQTKRDYPHRPIVGVGAVIVDNARALIVKLVLKGLGKQT